MAESVKDQIKDRLQLGCSGLVVFAALTAAIGWCGSRNENKAAQATSDKAAAVIPAAAPAKPHPVEPEAIAPPRGASLPHTSLGRLQGYLANTGIDLKPSKLMDGRPRLFASSPDKMTIIELLEPEGDSITGGSITAAFIKEQPESFSRNVVLVMLFMRETGWKKGIDWVTSVMATGGKKTVNGIVYEVILITPGLICLTANPVAVTRQTPPARPPATKRSRAVIPAEPPEDEVPF